MMYVKELLIMMKTELAVLMHLHQTYDFIYYKMKIRV
mgnify:CR=1 FL=1|jgi:hypothetical protein